MQSGWIKVHRSLLNTSIWNDSTPTQKVVFITLNLLAIYSGDKEISPGELCLNEEALLRKCGKGISIESLEEALLFLEDKGCISYEKNEGVYLIKLINWIKVQCEDGDGWIKLHRKVLNSYLWVNSIPRQRVIYLCLLLKANSTSHNWNWGGKNYEVKPGEFITSVKTIIEVGGKDITPQSVRLTLKKFKDIGFINYETTTSSHLIKINNWGKYQSPLGEDGVLLNKIEGTKVEQSKGNEGTRLKQSLNKEGTKKEQSWNKEGTTNKKEKNDKKDKKDKNDKKERKDNSLSVEFENKDAYEAYSECGFGLINHTIIQKIDEDIKIFSKEWVIEALKVAARNNKHSYSYVEGILRNWRANGKNKPKEGESVNDEYEDDFDRILGSGWYRN